jgi:hypothetical protein
MTTTNGNGKHEPPTFALVEARIKQRALVQRRIESLAAEEAELSALIRAGHREDEPADATEARERRNECREDIADLTATLHELDAEIPLLLKEAAYESGRLRLIAIQRADGSLGAQEEEDDRIMTEASNAYAAAMGRKNERHTKRCLYREETVGLVDRFGLQMPKLEPLITPAASDACLQARAIVRDASPSTRTPKHLVEWRKESDEHGFNERHTYIEIRHTLGGQIIEKAGLKPWPAALTPDQEEIVAKRQADSREAQEQAETIHRSYVLPGQRLGLGPEDAVRRARETARIEREKATRGPATISPELGQQ